MSIFFGEKWGGEEWGCGSQSRPFKMISRFQYKHKIVQ